MTASDSESDQSVASPTFSPTSGESNETEHESNGAVSGSILPPTVTLPVPQGIHDHGAQRDWEHYQVAKGVERYHRSLIKIKKDGSATDKGLEDTLPGQRIATELIRPLADAIAIAQATALDELSNPSLKLVPDVTAALTALPAETLAACTVLTALANPVDASYTSVAIAVAARIRHELEYKFWKDAEAAAEKARKEFGEEGINLFKLMLKRTEGDVDKRAFDKWAKKSERFRKLEWNQDLKVRIGAALIELLIESTGWFQVQSSFDPMKGKASLRFGMVDEALAATSSIDAQCELQRPFMAPMICEPMDYVPRPPVLPESNA